MSKHPQRFLILGFFDKPLKAAGTDQITYFSNPDCYECDHIPSQDNLRHYAKWKGYAVSDAKCAAIYTVLGDGLEYCSCLECFPSQGEVTDNRTSVDA